MSLYLAYDSAEKANAAAKRDGGNKLLIAVRPEDRDLVMAIVGNEFNIALCHTFTAAQAHMDETVKLVVCGVHFDNGKVFDFLRYVRESPSTENVPFFILLGAGSRYSPAIIDGIRAAAKLLRVTGFTDLTRFADKVGKEAAYEALRQGIRDTLVQRGEDAPVRPALPG